MLVLPLSVFPRYVSSEIILLMPPSFRDRTLAGFSEFDPSAAGLIWELLDAPTKVRLALQGQETSSSIIQILAKELAYSPYSLNHLVLDSTPFRTIQMILYLRPLALGEMDAIRRIADRHLQQ
jgi:hypothetical protein